MRKGLQYLERALECRKIAYQLRDFVREAIFRGKRPQALMCSGGHCEPS